MSSLHPTNIDEITRSNSNLITFKEDLTRAIIGAFPTGRMPFRRVRAALIRWDVDDTKSEESVEEIGRVFEDYGYACRKYIIPARSETISPYSYFRKLMIEVADAGEKADLTIFYYAGHSIWDPVRSLLQFQ
jgi:hypothetical protein